MIATQAEKDKNRNLYFENEYLIANLSASNLNPLVILSNYRSIQCLFISRFKKNANLNILITSVNFKTIKEKYGARGRSRTGTEVSFRGILSPLRLPISPPGHEYIRLGPESNRCSRLCRPLHNHSATQPCLSGNET